MASASDSASSRLNAVAVIQRHDLAILRLHLVEQRPHDLFDRIAGRGQLVVQQADEAALLDLHAIHFHIARGGGHFARLDVMSRVLPSPRRWPPGWPGS